MKSMRIIECIVSILFIVLVPAIPAIQIQTVETELATSPITYEALKHMDAGELIVFIQTLTKDSPQLSKEFENAIQEIEDSPVSPRASKNIQNLIGDKNQGPQPRNDNQTFLEKIFWKIYNYRVFRLVVSTLLFITFQSKFTLWRTMSWGIRLLRWTKLGILLGYIDPSQQHPQTPTIDFQQDLVNKTLTVVSIVPVNSLWSDITEIGAGSCNPLPEGNISAGDMITNCTGIIVLQYVPTYEILGVFEFD